MTKRIPKDFAAKPLPRYMARKPNDAPPAGEIPTWKAVLYLSLAFFAFVGCTFGIMEIIDLSRASGSVQAAQDTPGVREALALTPFQPEKRAVVQSVTLKVLPKEPTSAPPTLWPSPTWTPRPSQTIVPTRTPRPSRTATVTPTITPTSTETPIPTATRSRFAILTEHSDEMKMWNDRIVMRLKEWFLSPAFITITIIVIVATSIWIWTVKMIDRNVKAASSESTMEDIGDEVPERSEYWHPLYPDYRARIWFLRGKKEYIPKDIVHDLWPQNKSAGGIHHVWVTDVLKTHDPLGEYGPATPPPYSPTALNNTAHSSSR